MPKSTVHTHLAPHSLKPSSSHNCYHIPIVNFYPLSAIDIYSYAHISFIYITLYHLFFTIVYACLVCVYAYNLSSSIYKYLPFIYQALIYIKGIYLCLSLMYIGCYLCCNTHVIVSDVPGSTVTLF